MIIRYYLQFNTLSFTVKGQLHSYVTLTATKRKFMIKRYVLRYKMELCCAVSKTAYVKLAIMDKKDMWRDHSRYPRLKSRAYRSHCSIIAETRDSSCAL